MDNPYKLRQNNKEKVTYRDFPYIPSPLLYVSTFYQSLYISVPFFRNIVLKATNAGPEDELIFFPSGSAGCMPGAAIRELAHQGRTARGSDEIDSMRQEQRIALVAECQVVPRSMSSYWNMIDQYGATTSVCFISWVWKK